MNKQYRIVWNESTQCWVAVMELARSRGKSTGTRIGLHAARHVGAHLLQALACAVSALGLAYAAPHANSQLPTGGQVVAGQATLNQSGNVLNVNQSSTAAIVNWQSFNVGSAAAVNFVQPSAASTTLNRVLDTNPSQIFGRITAPGQVFFTNPGGMYFAPGSSVDVGGLTATTHSISDADFMAGHYRFERNGATGSIVNDGNLTANLGGYIALLAPEVRNQGVIVARMGTVALAAGEAFDLQMQGTQLGNVRVSPATIQALVDNANAVMAPGGLIILSAQAANQLQGSVVNSGGAVMAQGLAMVNGRVVLDAGANGAVNVSGSVSAASGSGKGGDITITGKDIRLQSASTLDASGSLGGGKVLVGGDWQGSGTLLQATTVSMDAGVSINASATQNGDGGKVVLWSDVHNAAGHTTAHGSILARGGAIGGIGGLIETSGHMVDISGLRANAGADVGQGGQWLLDPFDYTIDATAASTIVGSLNGGTNVTIDTANNTGPGAGASSNGDITVSSAIAKTAGTAATLTLNATRDIVVNADITSATDTLATTLNAGTGSISGVGNFNTNGGLLTLNAATTGTLSGVISGTGALAKSGAGTTTFTGNNTYTGTTAINAGGLVLRNDSTAISTSGFTGTGALTIEPAGTSFGSALSTGAIFGSNLSSLTLGKAGNTANISLGGITSIAGPVSITGGSVAINAALAATGNILLNADTGSQLSFNGAGVLLTAGVSTSNAGDITITGRGGDNSAGSQYGINLGAAGTVSTSGTGNISMTGYGGASTGNSNHGIGLTATSAQISTASGNITLTGFGGGTGSTTGLDAGVFLGSSSTTLAGGAGAINITGTGGSAASNGNGMRGIYLNAGSINSGGGSITLTGTGGANSSGLVTTHSGIQADTSGNIGASSGNAPITLIGTDTRTGANGIRLLVSSVGGNSYTGNIVLRADGLSSTTPKSGTSAVINTSGTLTIEPLSTSFISSGLNTKEYNFTRLTGLTLGKAGNTGPITWANTASIAGPITLYGGDISIDANLTSTLSGAGILLKASGNIVQNSTAGAPVIAVTTNVGDVTYWADSDASGAGAIRLQNNASITTNSGNVFFGGGTLLATGFAASTNGSPYGNGVEVSVGASVAAGAGSVTMRGKGYDTGAYSDGVRINGTGATISGGNITLVGQGSNVGGAYARGVTIGSGASVTGSGAVSITGTGGATAGDGNEGVSIGGTPALAISATGTGTLTIVGTGGGTGDSVGAATLTFADKNAGTGKTVTLDAVTVSDGNGGNNYTITRNGNNTSTVTRRAILLTGITAANKTYDGSRSIGITGGSFSNLVAGETLGISGSGTLDNRNAGTGKTVTVADATTLTQTDGSGAWSNYALGSGGSSTTADVERKSVTLTAANVVKTYDGLLGYVPQANDLAALSSQLGATGDSVSTATITFVDKNAGSGKTLLFSSAKIADGSGGNNYSVTLVGNTTSSIAKAALLVAANDADKTQDGSPFLGGNGVRFAGFVNGETTAELSGALAYGGNSQGAVLPGNYAIEVSGLGASNYAIRYTPGNLRLASATVPFLEPIAIGKPGVDAPGNRAPNNFGSSSAGPVSSNPVAASVMERALEPAPGRSNVYLQVVYEPTVQGSGFTLVYVPTAVRNAGQGFRFTLPDRAAGEPAANETVQATLINGEALPDWLGFNGNTRTFVASSVPAGGLPMRVRVRSGGKISIVELLETSS